MKKVLILSLSVVALSAMSCKKCQTCTTDVTQEYNGFPMNVSSTSEEYCGNDYDNAPAESTVNQNGGGVQQTVTITCTDS